MGRLELRREEGGGLAYALDGLMVRAGQDLEILLQGGLWLTGRFEWSGGPQARPRLHLCCGGPWEELSVESDTLPIPSEISFEIPRDALLRWPGGAGA